MSTFSQLKEYITRDIIVFYCTDTDPDIKDAMAQFYNSEVFNKLDDPETGLYLSSSAYVYGLFCDEMQHGSIVQQEI